MSTLAGEASPLSSDLGLTSSSSGPELALEDEDEERLGLMRVVESDGELWALAEVSCLMAVTDVELISWAKFPSSEASRFIPFASWPSTDAGVEAPEVDLAIVKDC